MRTIVNLQDHSRSFFEHVRGTWCVCTRVCAMALGVWCAAAGKGVHVVATYRTKALLHLHVKSPPTTTPSSTAATSTLHHHYHQPKQYNQILYFQYHHHYSIS